MAPTLTQQPPISGGCVSEFAAKPLGGSRTVSSMGCIRESLKSSSFNESVSWSDRGWNRDTRSALVRVSAMME